MAYNQIGNLHKAIFLDRDGVINEETGVYNWRIEDFIINHIRRKIDNPIWRRGLKEELLSVLRVAEQRR